MTQKPILGSQLTRLMSGSLVLTTLGRSTNINNGRTIIITCRITTTTKNQKRFSSTLACETKPVFSN